MSKNDGKVHYTNYAEKPREEQEKIAAEFSEGSEDLKDFMLYLWGKGFNTVASCAGHEEKKFKELGTRVEHVLDEEKNKIHKIETERMLYAGYPYITIDVTMIDRIFKDRGISAKRLLLNLYKNKEIPDLTIERFDVVDEEDETKEIVRLVIILDGDASLFKNLKKNFEDLESADKYKQDLTEEEKSFLNVGMRLMTGNIHDSTLNRCNFNWVTGREGRHFSASTPYIGRVAFDEYKEEELSL